MGAVVCAMRRLLFIKRWTELKRSKTSKASALIAFSSFFASKRTSKYAVFAIVGGTSLLFTPNAQAVQISNVQVTCATQAGEQRTFTIGWDNSNAFFQDKGAISRLYCEGGYAGDYRVFVSNNLTDKSLDFYNGIAPVTLAPVVETPTVVSPVETPTATVDSPTATVESAPANPDTPTATVSDTPTVVQETQTAPVVSESSTTHSTTVSDTSSTTVPDTSTPIVPVETSTPVEQPSTPIPEQPAPSSPTPAPVEPTPVPVVVEPTPAPAPPTPIVIPDPAPAPEPVEPPAPEPEPAPPVEPEPAPPAPEEPAPAPVEPAPVPPVEPEPAPTPVEPPAPEPTPTPLPTPEPIQVNTPQPLPSADPVSINSVDVATLPPDTPVELENGVILAAEVVVALQLLENPADLIGAIFSDPGQALMALGSIGADMSPEVREKSEKVVISAIIAGGIATQAAGLAAASTYRRNP